MAQSMMGGTMKAMRYKAIATVTAVILIDNLTSISLSHLLYYWISAQRNLVFELSSDRLFKLQAIYI